jgi:hypothetical protein
VATNSNNLEQNFEALLRAQLQTQGAANFVVCEQFDPDTANAYLERSLTKNALKAYEEHLTHCVSCRRHIVELARLMPAPMVAAESVVVVPPPSLKERFSEWFTGWRLGALAGVGVAVATVLLVAVVVNRPEQGLLIAQQKGEPAAVLDATPTPNVKDSDIEKQVRGKIAAPEMVAAARRNSASSPRPATPTEAESSIATVSPPPPAPVTQTERKEVVANQAGQRNEIAPSKRQDFRDLPANSPAADQSQSLKAKREAPATVAAAPTARPVAKPAEGAVEKEQKTENKASTDARRDESAARKSSDEERQQAARAKAKSSDSLGMTAGGRSTAPVKNVGSKSFRYENGFWTDTEYDAGKGLPGVRLQSESEAYRRILSEFPSLKPYFDLKPVVVVWQGKVYRVEKK